MTTNTVRGGAVKWSLDLKRTEAILVTRSELGTEVWPLTVGPFGGRDPVEGEILQVWYDGSTPTAVAPRGAPVWPTTWRD
jgi:hypothetical protein